jgi:hypothetical protein
MRAGAKGNRVVASHAVVAAALQDHLARRMKSALTMPPRVRRKKPSSSARAKQTRAPGPAAAAAAASNAGASSSPPPTAAEAAYLRWACESCTLLNADAAPSCVACGNRRPPRAVDDVHFTRYAPKLSLAQSLGLVAAPAAPLTKEEWGAVRASSAARGDSAVEASCAICREPFRSHKQVLLSCTHVFHKVCLQNFERLCRASERACPICRHARYQKCMITEGAEQFELASSMRVQRAWRASRARRELGARREKWLRAGGGTLAQRRRWQAETLAASSARLDCAMASEQSSVSALLRTLGGSLARTKHVAARVALQATVDWARVAASARSRDEASCPICMGDLGALAPAAGAPPTCGPPGASLRRAQQRRQKAVFQRPCSLLSCSHVFHAKCLDAFEEFALTQMSGGDGASHNGCLCPICRQTYLRMPL